VPDYYEQPAYLKELETTTVTAPPNEEVSVTVTEEKPKRNIPILFLVGLGVILFLVLIYLLFLSRGGNTPTTPPSNQKVTLQWWGVYLDSSVVKPLIDEYQSLNPNVTIQYADRWPDGKYDVAADIYQKELNRVLKQADPVDIPDIFMVENSWAGDYEAYVRTSSSYDYDTFKSIFYPAIVSDFGDEATKAVYGVPLWMDTLAIIYNKDMLKAVSVSEPPTDWASFKTLAKNLTKRQSNAITQSGFAAGAGSNVSFSPEVLNLLMAQNGVTIVNAEGQPVFGSDTDSVTALSSFKDYTNPTTGTWSSTSKVDAASFLEGKLAMMVGTSYKYRDIKIFNEAYQLGIDIGVSQFPQLQGQSQDIMNWSNYWGMMAAKDRPNSQAAWAFMKWMTEPDQLRKLSKNEADFNKQFGLLYPRADMNQDLQADANLKVFNASLPFAVSWDMVKGLAVKQEFVKLINQGSANQSNIVSTQNAIQSLISNKGQL
jgi:ABC-type glycerol-3-phosphate transport system substrate-binding protein